MRLWSPSHVFCFNSFFTHYAVRGFESPQAWCKPFICVRNVADVAMFVVVARAFGQICDDLYTPISGVLMSIHSKNPLPEGRTITSADFTDPVVWHGPRCWESCNLQFKNIAPNQRVVMQDQPGWKNARKHCAGSQQEFLYCTWAACLPVLPQINGVFYCCL